MNVVVVPGIEVVPRFPFAEEKVKIRVVSDASLGPMVPLFLESVKGCLLYTSDAADE